MTNPGYSEAQRIGNLGKRHFQGNHPNTWTSESEPTEGADFGFDISMWVTSLGDVAGRFSVQIKTVTSVVIRGSDEKFVSVPLRRETCNIFVQDGHPIMLVLVALDDPHAAQSATMYYLWITDQIIERLGDREFFDESDPEEMSFRIPIGNVLNHEVDISDYLRRHWTYNALANRLRQRESGSDAVRTLTKLSAPAIAGLGAVSPRSLDLWAAHGALGGDAPWATPRTGSVVGALKAIADAISLGDEEEAERLLKDISPAEISPEDVDVLAEFHYQQGRLESLKFDSGSALESFTKATELQQESPRYLAAALEMSVLVNIDQPTIVPDELMKRADVQKRDDVVTFQLVRIHALAGRHSIAESLLDELGDVERRKAIVIYRTIRGDWSGTVEAADAGLALEMDPRQRRFLRLVKAKALLKIVLGDADYLGTAGRPDLPLEDAIRLRDCTIDALKDSKKANWPANSEYLLDCASAVCLVFGGSPELFELILDFSGRRPGLPAVHETLARVATFEGKPEAAVAALKQLSPLDAANAARLTLLLGESGKYRDAVLIAKEQLLDASHEELIDLAVAMAVVSANRLGAVADEEVLRAYVLQGGRAGKAILRFIEVARQEPEEISSALDALWQEAMDGDGDETLQDNLFLYLKPNRDSDIDRIIELGGAILKRRGLTQMESAKYSSALLGKQRIDEVLEFSGRAIKLYPDDENIALARAVALDRVGQSSAAEALLRTFEDSTRLDLLQSRSYLLLRVGEISTAIEVVQRALADAKEPEHKFHFQKSLALLYNRIDPHQFARQVWRLGQIARPENEAEEGAFLALFAMATSGAATQVDDSQIRAFQERVVAFTKRFPNSPIFRVGEFPESSSPGDLLDNLYRIAGITEKTVRNHTRLRNLGERSGSYYPLVMRPRGLAPFTSNAAELLCICIQGSYSGLPARIITDDLGSVGRTFGAAPILDLVTLMALVELGLFERLFDVWTAVAVPKTSLQTLSEWSLEPLPSAAQALIDKSIEAVRKWKACIVQPGSAAESGASFPALESATIAEEMASGNWEYLSLDSASRVWIGNSASGGVHHSIWDLLHAAEAKGALSPTDSRVVRLRIASWNTSGTPLSNADIAAACLGHIQTGGSDEVEETTTRVVVKALSGLATPAAIECTAETLVDIASDHSHLRESAALWFSRIAYRDLLLARGGTGRGGINDLTARLFVLAVAMAQEREAPAELVRIAWSVLTSLRDELGAADDRAPFLRILGGIAAELLEKLAQRNEMPSIMAESKFRELLFSCVTPGTQDRDTLETSYFSRTRELQQSQRDG